jgi:hypothetical protein
MNFDEKLITIAENQQKVFDAGKTKEWSDFWDSFQQNGNRTSYSCSFGSGWNVENFRPKYPIRPTNAYMMFFNNVADSIDVDDFDVWCEENNIVIDFSSCTNGVYAIATLHANKFNTLNFSKCTSLANLFYSHNGQRFGAVEINNFVVSETTVFNDTTFQQATRLTKLIMNGTIASNGLNVSYCKNLTHESLMSIITALKDFSGVGGSHKVTLGGDNIAQLTNDELNMIEVKGWNYA